MIQAVRLWCSGIGRSAGEVASRAACSRSSNSVASWKATEQPIDTSTATGKAFLDMLGVFAEFETNLRKERQLEGIAKAKAAGVYKGLALSAPSISSLSMRIRRTPASEPKASLIGLWRFASGERDPPDDSLPSAGLFTSRSAAIAIALAGLPIGEFDAWMEGCSAHQPILGGRPYFAILCLPPYSRIPGTVLGTVDSGPAIGGRWLE